jgi:hypothetical protein
VAIADSVKDALNDLEIDVVNTWFNRFWRGLLSAARVTTLRLAS